MSTIWLNKIFGNEAQENENRCRRQNDPEVAGTIAHSHSAIKQHSS
jgi:hypothetical protein